MFIVEHLKEYLRGDIVRVIARQHKGLARENIVEIHAQEVFAQHVFCQKGEVLMQVFHRFGVYFHHAQWSFLGGKILGEHAHTWSHFENG